jgi:inorganic phosphate transporter, PiT family
MTYFIVHGIGGFVGATIGFLLLVGVSGAIWWQSRKEPIDHNNVNNEWEGSLTAGTGESDAEKPKTPETV